MKMVSTAEFKTNANHWFRRISSAGQPVIITRHGRPCAVVEPFTEDDIEDLAFEYGSEVRRMAKESAADLRARRVVSLKSFAKKNGLAR